MTATCDKCEEILSDDEIQDAEKIYAAHPVADCVGCAMAMMRSDEEILQ